MKISSLTLLHPIFRLFPNDLYLLEQCEMINEYGNSNQCFVAFHLSGIFILEIKTFQRNYSISTIIPLFYVSNLIATKESLLISYFKDKFIELKFQQYLKFAAYFYMVKTIIYDNPNLEFNFEIDESLREKFDSIDISSLSVETNAANQFIGMVLCNKSFNEYSFMQLYKILKAGNAKTIKINEIVFNNQYINEFVKCISLSNETEEVIIENIELGDFYAHLKIMILYSQSIKTLIFKDTSFQRNFESYKNIFEEPKQLLRIESISFQNCKFISNETNFLFDSFSGCLSHIKNLKVDGCFLTNFTIDYIFQALFFSNCFHSLEMVNFSNISLPDDITLLVFQLLCCGWVLEKKCLATVVLRNCGIKVDELLSRLKDIDCGIISLDLGYNTFYNSIDKLGFGHLEELVLDHCTFTGESLLNFFTLLEKEDPENLITIDLSRILADDKCLSNFYQNSSKLRIPKLNGLLWNDNKITSSTIEHFSNFLKMQPNLMILSISRCIQPEDRQNCLPFLVDLVRSHPFEQFCIATTNDNSFGSSLVPLIEVLVKESHLRLLDITNQNIGDIGMSIILTNTSSLEELWFDDFHPSTAESFINICNLVLKHPNLKFASFPNKDAAFILLNLRFEQRSNFNKQINALKTAFQEKFGAPNNNTKDEQKPNIDTRVQTKKKTKPEFFFHSIDREKFSQILELEKCFQLYYNDQDSIDIFKECSDVIGSTPILKQIEENEQKTSIATLVSILQKK